MGRPEAITIRTPHGPSLEGRFTCSERGRGSPLALIAPPHPLHGGSIGSPVVRALEHAFQGVGLGTLSFNFRGVGESTGEPSGEMADAQVDYTAAANALPQAPLHTLSGYSFGSIAALHVAIARDVPRLWMVAPPLFLLVDAPLPEYRGKIEVFVGDDDPYAPADGLTEEFARAAQGVQFHVLPGVDHFFIGSAVIALGEQLRAALANARD